MSAIAKLGDGAARIAERTIPDPFVIAILLLACVFGAGLAFSDATVSDLSTAFATGSLSTPYLAFAFRMALILVTGHALADAPIMQRLLARVSAAPKSTATAAALVAFVAMFLGLLNWGLGLVGGAFLAREVGRAFARRQQPLNYALIGAAGYTGMLVFHGGFSGSAPLKVAKESVLGAAIPIDSTLLTPMNLGVSLALLILIPALFFSLGRGQGAQKPYTLPKSDSAPLDVRPGIVGYLESGGLAIFLLASPLLVAIVYLVRTKGTGAVTLDFVILMFLLLGLVAHQSPSSYARSFGLGARGSAGILLQFPIYFGILAVAKEAGVLEAAARSMNGLMSDFAGLSPNKSAPLLTFATAGFINMVVPSGGGQWVLQAPLIADACKTFELSKGTMVMAFSYGDQVTNMLQPFWALPLLSITGLKARELLGYTIIAMLAAIPVFVAALFIVGAGATPA